MAKILPTFCHVLGKKNWFSEGQLNPFAKIHSFSKIKNTRNITCEKVHVLTNVVKLTSLAEKDEDEDGETIKKEEDVSDGIPEATEEEVDKTPVKRPKARRKGSKRSSKGKGSKAKADNRSSSKPDIKMEETDNDLSQGEDLVGGDATSSKTEDSSKTEALVKRGSEIEMSSDLAAAGGGAVASTSVKSEAASSADEGQDKDEAMVKTSSNIHRLGFSTFLDPE